MKKMVSGPDYSDQSGIFSQQHQGAIGDERQAAGRGTFWRVIVGILALVLLGTASVSSFTTVTDSHAMPDCGILLPCPTPTPTQTATPKPTPKPTTPPQPTPTSALSPTVQAVPSPTVALSPIVPASNPTPTPATPSATPTRASVSAGPIKGPREQQPLDQGSSNNLIPTVEIGVLIFLMLFLVLGVGGLILRRTLGTSTATKQPASSAYPWARTRGRNPESLAGLTGHTMETYNARSFTPTQQSVSMGQASAVPVPNMTIPDMPTHHMPALPNQTLHSNPDGFLASTSGGYWHGSAWSWDIRDDPYKLPEGLAPSHQESLGSRVEDWQA